MRASPMYTYTINTHIDPDINRIVLMMNVCKMYKKMSDYDCEINLCQALDIFCD